MSVEIVSASLSIDMWVDCPGDDCGNYINLLNEKDTDGRDHNDDGALLRQMFPVDGDNSDFECDDVTCPECGTTFNVRELEW